MTKNKYTAAFILVTCLFFMWGLSYGLVDVLNKHFQNILEVSKAQSGLIQAAYFGAYFVAALPSALFMNKMGYKAGIMLGLSLYAVGALLFLPATGAMSFNLFLGALFVLALGLGCIETAANPYSAALGDPEKSESRLNLSQAFNGLGQFAGPLIGGTLFFRHAEAESVKAAAHGMSSVRLVYVGIAIAVLILLVLFAKTKLPDLRENEEEMDEYMAECGQKSLWSHKEFVFGVGAQLFYVAAQVGMGAFFINLTLENWPEATAQKGAYFLSAAMLLLLVGRFTGTAIMQKLAPSRLLLIYSSAGAVLMIAVIFSIQYVSVIALMAAFFFISIMFPPIFAMGIKNLGSHTKIGSSFMIMAIVGGAIMPYFMGRLADGHHTALGFILPAGCFVLIGLYAAFYPRLAHKSKTDAEACRLASRPSPDAA